jgi:glycosyltransferase involved in cell wall biosynthesis
MLPLRRLPPRRHPEYIESFMRGVVATILPQPDPARDRHGIYRRLGMFLRALKDVCDDIELIHFAGPEEMASAVSSSRVLSAFWDVPVSVRLAPLNVRPRSWWQAASVPFTLRYRRDFRPYIGPDQAGALQRIFGLSPDLIFAHRLPVMTALLQLPPMRVPIFFDLDDLDHRVKWRSAQTAASQLETIRNSVEVPALLAAERQAVGRAARTFVCSPVDRRILSDLDFDVSRTAVIPNAADIPNSRPGISREQRILFLGHYGYAPNAEAAERLVKRIWPKVRARVECATLVIAGAQPEHIPSYHRGPTGVEFTGFVEDLNSLYTRTRIVCCPISNGGGTRLKLIEAAGFGKPAVVSSVAVEGLAFIHRRDVLVHDDDDALAVACVRLLQDDVLADRLAAAAYDTVRTVYSFADVARLIARELRDGLAAYASDHFATDDNSAPSSPIRDAARISARRSRNPE